MNAINLRLRIARCIIWTLVACTLSPSAPIAAQAPGSVFRISQRAAVEQQLSNTDIRLEYSRPLVRGRTDLFGGLVHWGELWTPGANEASVLELSDTVKLNGHAVPDGRWSMWIIPSEVGPWELVLDARDTLFHTERPELTDEQIRFVVDVHEAAHTEALTWSFTRIAPDGGTLEMNWGNTRIPIDVEVEPNTPELTVAGDEAALYTGEWEIRWEGGPPDAPPSPPAVLTITHGAEGRLNASMSDTPGTPPPPAPADTAAMTPQERERARARRTLAEMDAGGFDYLLVPRARGVFLFGYVDDGVLLEVSEIFHEFEIENEGAVRLVVRGPEDRVFARGTRRSR
jgi:hypothetical protein